MAKDYCFKTASRNIAMKMSRHGLKKGKGQKRLWRSIGSERTCRDVLCVCGRWLWTRKHIRLENASHKDFTRFLIDKAQYVCQKTLDRYIMILERVSGNKFTPIKSAIESVKPRSRAYSNKWFAKLIASCNCSRLAISIALCYFCGLRAVELCNISRLEEQPISSRDWLGNLFLYSPDWVPYTVNGKGGLIRMVAVPIQLAEMLEKFRRDSVAQVIDREIFHASRYDIPCGKKFSSRMAHLSKRYFGLSNGAHGLRYSYTQRRLTQLVAEGLLFTPARYIVAQEIGHFSDSNIRYYLVGSPFAVFLKSGGRYELKNHTQTQLCMMAKDDWINNWSGVDVLEQLSKKFFSN